MEIAVAGATHQDPEVRAALKKEQLARLALKREVADGKRPASDYSEAYSKHPNQVAVKEQQTAQRMAQQNALVAAKRIGLSNAETGASIFEAGAAAVTDDAAGGEE